jgi:hypothetical protein
MMYVGMSSFYLIGEMVWNVTAMSDPVTQGMIVPSTASTGGG